MTLQASGPISLADINAELGRAANTGISFNDAVVRTLAGKPSGIISLDDFHGKSNYTGTLVGTTSIYVVPVPGAEGTQVGAMDQGYGSISQPPLYIPDNNGSGWNLVGLYSNPYGPQVTVEIGTYDEYFQNTPINQWAANYIVINGIKIDLLSEYQGAASRFSISNNDFQLFLQAYQSYELSFYRN